MVESYKPRQKLLSSPRRKASPLPTREERHLRNSTWLKVALVTTPTSAHVSNVRMRKSLEPYEGCLHDCLFHPSIAGGAFYLDSVSLRLLSLALLPLLVLLQTNRDYAHRRHTIDTLGNLRMKKKTLTHIFCHTSATSAVAKFNRAI